MPVDRKFVSTQKMAESLTDRPPVPVTAAATPPNPDTMYGTQMANGPNPPSTRPQTQKATQNPAQGAAKNDR